MKTRRAAGARRRGLRPGGPGEGVTVTPLKSSIFGETFRTLLVSKALAEPGCDVEDVREPEYAAAQGATASGDGALADHWPHARIRTGGTPGSTKRARPHGKRLRRKTKKAALRGGLQHVPPSGAPQLPPGGGGAEADPPMRRSPPLKRSPGSGGHSGQSPVCFIACMTTSGIITPLTAWAIPCPVSRSGPTICAPSRMTEPPEVDIA